MLRAPWETSLRCHGALGLPPATLRRVCCDATATCFRGNLTALVLSMFKTWRRPRRPWRPYCDLQRCHGALWDLTTTQRRSAAIWPIFADCSEVAVLCDWGITKHFYPKVMQMTIFSCDQAAIWLVQSVCPSVRPSPLFHHVPIIVSSWNFQELLPWTEVMSMQKVKVRGQRSRSQRSTPNLAVSRL